MASFDDLTPEEKNALISQPAEWGSEWATMPAPMGSDETCRYRMIYGWNATHSWTSMVYDYTNYSDGRLNTIKTSYETNPTPGDEYIWNGRILTIKTATDNPTGISNIANSIRNSVFSADLKTMRLKSSYGDYIYYYKLN